MEQAIFAERLLRSRNSNGIRRCFANGHRLLEGRPLFVQGSGLGEETDPGIRMKNFLDARSGGHGEKPEQRKQSYQSQCRPASEGRAPRVRADSRFALARIRLG